MSARPIGSGTISFGLVSIPVKLYSANDTSSRLSFNQLHKKCKGRLKQQLYCPTDNEVVPREDIVKGYEYAKDQYVVLSDDELEGLEEESTKAMEISEFVPLDTVDPLYFESGYYLGPDKGAERAYRLLAAALAQTGKAGVAKYSSRGKENLILLRPLGDGLVMQQLRYSDEVRAQADVPQGDIEVKEAELGLAKQFIDSLTTERFDAQKYRDDYRARVQEVIEQKVKGEEVTFAAAPNEPAKVVDLMEALKASLARSGELPAAPPLSGTAPEAKSARKPPKRVAAKPSVEKKPRAAKR